MAPHGYLLCRRGRTLTRCMRRRDFFFWIAGSAGTALAAAHALTIERTAWPSILLFALFFGFGIQLNVTLPSGLRVSAAYPLLYASLVNLGIGPTMIMMLPGIMARVVTLGDSWLYTYYVYGQFCISAFAAGSAFLLGGTELGRIVLPGGIASLLLAGLVWDVVNLGLAQGRVVLQQGGNWLRGWWQALVVSRGPVGPIYHVLGFTAALLYQDRGVYGLILTSLALRGLHSFFRLHADFLNVRRVALTDRLTGVHNYRLLSEWMQREFPRVTAGRAPLSVLWVDVDNLKLVNDGLGHEAGNVLLKAVADLLRSKVRASDLVVRYGGDEFVVVLPGSGAEEAGQVVERILEALGHQHFIIEGSAVKLGLSIGQASYPADAETPQELLTAADRAMYQVKERKLRVELRSAL